MPMDVAMLMTPQQACARAADIIAQLMAMTEHPVLALPAGATPRPLYAELVRRHRQGRLSLARATAFSLDEYAGIAPDHQASFRRYLDDELFRHVDLPRARIHGPDATAADLDDACARYEQAIAAAGGIDLCVLGIGANGHIAFNEPGSPFDSRTRVVNLTEETRSAAVAAFGTEPVPARALTVGIATILASRHCVLLATGAAKAGIVARLMQEPPSPALPASALRLHRNVTVILDADALSPQP